jgi:hypothetical protein
VGSVGGLDGESGVGLRLGFGRRELSGIWVLRKGSLVIVVEEDRVVIGRRFHFLESEIAESVCERDLSFGTVEFGVK